MSMANAVALTKQERERAEPSAQPRGGQTAGPAMEQPIMPGAGSGPSLWTVYEDYFATGEGRTREPEASAISGAPVLWTAWLDYFATGEGRSLMACIAFASNEAEIRAHFGTTFDPWYAQGCDVGPGVVRNDLTCTLWSTVALEMIESCAAQGAWVDAHSWLHFNFS